MADAQNITNIKGIGEKTAGLFHKLDVYTDRDLLHFFPRTYVQYPVPSKLATGRNGEYLSVRLCIADDFKFKKLRRINIGSGKATDGDHTVALTFFNSPYLRSRLIRGAVYVFYGRLLVENGLYKMEQPAFYTEEEYRTLQSSLQPVYSLTKGLSNKTVQKAVKSVMESGASAVYFEEYLPKELRDEYELMDLRSAYASMHYPDDLSAYQKARNRLVFDELFAFLSMLRRLRSDGKKTESAFPMMDSAYPDRLMEMLPYRLTNAQIRAFREIREDLTSGYVMNRLIQGDVGSGKTIVSFLSLLLCVENGYQGALMVPTEILAQQHFENLKELTETYGLPFRIACLTGSTTAKNKKLIYEQLSSGEVNVVIGTHALIQDKVVFKNLALVITDEQHRFGARQRQTLSGKGGIPHILVMSATPIPRTLAIVMYGDLSISVIDEKPASRLPVKNCVVGTSYRETAYRFMLKEIQKGHQVYVICPMVSSSEELHDVCDVQSYLKKLREEMPESVRVDMLHGQMRPDAKRTVMEAFVDHHTDILVSTTVIEVGVDVPNATVMMIENAERFGLSALHQLRGRIGRGSDQSYCIFINGGGDEKHNKRLDVLNRSNDGFMIAKEDLKLRGAGDLCGIRQSGDLGLLLADIYEDSDLILRISRTLDELSEDPERFPPSEREKMEVYLEERMHKLIDFRTI